MAHPLDNVIWRALTTKQAHLGRRHGAASKFDEAVSILGGVEEGTRNAYACLAGLLGPGERVGVFLEEDWVGADLAIVSAVPLLQMVRERGDVPTASVDAELPHTALTESDAADMMALTELTKPGPFNPRTREMGDYFGIRRDGKLIAMSGERLTVPGFTEVSAICTHPDHLGRGHAASLTALLIRRIIERDERPFLHVKADNARAVTLYERMGFEKRWLGRYVVCQRA